MAGVGDLPEAGTGAVGWDGFGSSWVSGFSFGIVVCTAVPCLCVCGCVCGGGEGIHNYEMMS